MKRSIKWHEDCLKNVIRYKDQLLMDVNRILLEVDGLNEDISLRTSQIETAKVKKLTEFDGTRFLIKKVKKDDN